MARTSSRGAAPLTLRSWPFGAPSRRRLLEVVLQTAPPLEGWSKTALERACNVGVGTLDDHLAYLVELGLLSHRDGRFNRPAPLPPFARSLRAVLRQTAGVPEQPAAPLPRRPYARR
jgi:hypothetical protein